MDYCLANDDGAAAIWNGQPNLDLDGDGRLDAIGLDLDGDGMQDDALADFDGDGMADHAVLDLDDDGTPEAWFTDEGSGTWGVAFDRGGQLRWFGLDGVEHTGGPLVDFDGQGRADDRLLDSDGDGAADRVLCAGDGGVTGYVDTDGDGRSSTGSCSRRTIHRPGWITGWAMAWWTRSPR